MIFQCLFSRSLRVKSCEIFVKGSTSKLEKRVFRGLGAAVSPFTDRNRQNCGVDEAGREKTMSPGRFRSENTSTNPPFVKINSLISALYIDATYSDNGSIVFFLFVHRDRWFLTNIIPNRTRLNGVCRNSIINKNTVDQSKCGGGRVASYLPIR